MTRYITPSKRNEIGYNKKERNARKRNEIVNQTEQRRNKKAHGNNPYVQLSIISLTRKLEKESFGR